MVSQNMWMEIPKENKSLVLTVVKDRKCKLIIFSEIYITGENQKKWRKKKYQINDKPHKGKHQLFYVAVSYHTMNSGNECSNWDHVI